MTARQFTVTRKRPGLDHITTGLTMRQLLWMIWRHLPDGEQWVVEVRTQANDPMSWGP